MARYGWDCLCGVLVSWLQIFSINYAMWTGGCVCNLGMRRLRARFARWSGGIWRYFAAEVRPREACKVVFCREQWASMSRMRARNRRKRLAQTIDSFALAALVVAARASALLG